MSEYTSKELSQLNRECTERIDRVRRVRNLISELRRINSELEENCEELPQEEIEHYQSQKEDKEARLDELLPL